MSGGSLNYVYLRLQEAAEQISAQADGNEHNEAWHDHRDRLKAFAGTVQHWAELLRAVEFDFSQDQSLSESDLLAMDIYTKAAKSIHKPIPEPTEGKEGAEG